MILPSTNTSDTLIWIARQIHTSWYLWALRLEQDSIGKLRDSTNLSIGNIIRNYSWTTLHELPPSCSSCDSWITALVENKLINEIKKLRKIRLTSLILEIISRRIRRGSFYSSEDLLKKVSDTLWTIFPNTSIKVYWYIWWKDWVIDCISEWHEWRKIFNYLNQLDIWNLIKPCLSIHRQLIRGGSQSSVICYNPNPELWDPIIFTFEWYNEDEFELLKYLMETLNEIIIQWLEKINDRYISEVTWCKSKKYYIEHRDDRNMSAIAFDLNNFKSLNDFYWHAQWDKVLREFWKVLKSCVRENEWDVIHFSWDEFWIVLKSWDNNNFWEVMNIVLDRIEEKKKNWDFKTKLVNPDTWKEGEINIDFSMWYCTNKLWEWNMTLWKCYEQADLDMFRNKDLKWLINRLASSLLHLSIAERKWALDALKKQLWL